MHLGPTIKLLRLEAGMSLRALAREVGVTPAYLSQVENEKTPSPSAVRLEQIASALGVPTQEMLALAERLPAETYKFLLDRPDVRHLVETLCRNQIGPDMVAVLARLAVDPGLLNLVPGLSRDPAVRSLVPTRDDGSSLAVAALVKAEVGLNFKNKSDFLAYMAHSFSLLHPSVTEDDVRMLLEKREAEASTGIGAHLALPHVFVEGVSRPMCLLFAVPAGVDFEAVDGAPVKVAALLVGPTRKSPRHLTLLAHLARVLSRPAVIAQACRAHSGEELEAIFLSQSSGGVSPGESVRPSRDAMR